ncbi:unnamed protein product [Somion occarium]|uniref:DUF6534 domain-containing protein n=1 Tax=Somion occarium TaxID=3059160 RepID=A0ABP1D9N0_9APHY
MELCIALILYGVTTAQAYVYMLNCKKDPWWLKSMVAAVWILETVHTAFMLRQIYYYTIIGFGDFVAISKIDWSIGVSTSFVLGYLPSLNALSAGFVCGELHRSHCPRVLHTQDLDSERPHRSSYNWTGYSAGCTYWLPYDFGRIHVWPFLIYRNVVLIFRSRLLSPTWVSFQEKFAPNLCVEVANGLSASVDGIIAASMIFFLRRSQTGFKRTDGVLRWLMAYSVNTGAIMMIVSISIAITYSKVQGSLVFAGLVTIVSKLYANSFLGTLNARDIVRNKHQASSTTFDSTGFELPKFRNTTSGGIHSAGPRRIAFNHSTTGYTGSTGASRTILDDTDTKAIGLTTKASNDTGV